MSRLKARAAQAAVLGTFVLLVGVGTAAAATKPYALGIAPSAVPGGTAVTMTATFTNETATQQLGSANLFWPTQLSVLSASAPAPASATLSPSCTYGTLTGPCVALRNLALPPGGKVTITMSVLTPPGCAVGPFMWTDEAKQSNDFNGPPGNDLTLDSAHSSLSTTVQGACALKFGTQPRSVVVGQHITGTDYNPLGSPVTVDVLDQNGNLNTSSTAAVTVSLAANPGNAALGGTLTVNAVGGVATFPDLTVSAPANGYTLQASSTGVPSVTSSPFNANDQALTCTSVSTSCTVTDGNGAGNAQIAANAVDSGLLLESTNANAGAPLTCPGYTTNDPNVYEFLSTSANWSKVVTITIRDPANVTTSSAAALLGVQQLCFEAPYEFTTKSGAPAPGTTLPDGTVVYTGLLPNCPQAGGPCHARGSDRTISDPSSPTGFDIVLVANIPAGLPGDPRMG